MPLAHPPAEHALDRDRIVAAALTIVAAEGVDALSMRRLARTLDTAPMSLYRHVRGKDELLELVVDAIALRLPLPAAAAAWDDEVRGALRAIRRLLLAHPGIASLAAVRAPSTPAVITLVERILEALRRAGLREAESAAALAVLWNATLGMVLIEEAQLAAHGAQGLAAVREAVAEAFAAGAGGAHPQVAAVTPHMAAMDSDAEFEATLATLVAGLGAGLGRD